MADSVGSGFPSTGINKGHTFYDLDEESLWEYINGIPRLVSSWKLLSGRFSSDPDTSTWGTAQAGATWFNISSRLVKVWSGLRVRDYILVMPQFKPVPSYGTLNTDAGMLVVCTDTPGDLASSLIIYGCDGQYGVPNKLIRCYGDVSNTGDSINGTKVFEMGNKGECLMKAGPEPAIPPAGYLQLYARLTAGKMELAVKFPSGEIKAVVSET
jgi:hypothetical protein